jgi:hypothetical protein
MLASGSKTRLAGYLSCSPTTCATALPVRNGAEVGVPLAFKQSDLKGVFIYQVAAWG